MKSRSVSRSVSRRVSIVFFDPLFEKGPFPLKWDEKWPLPVTFPVKPGRQPGPRPAVEAIGPSPAGHLRRARPSRSPGDVRGEQQEQQRYR